MLPIATRNLWKRTLSWSRIKLVYTRITLTRYTTLYFFFALLNCIVLVILQGVTYADNNQAVNLIGGLLANANVEKGLLVFEGGELEKCNSIPGQPGAVCVTVALSKDKQGLASVERRGGKTELLRKRVVHKNVDSKALLASRSDSDVDDDSDSEDGDDDDDDSDSEPDDDSDDDHRKEAIKDAEDDKPTNGQGINSEIGTGNISDSQTGNAQQNGNSTTGGSSSGTSAGSANTALDLACGYTLTWLQDILQDAKREDLVTLGFHFWLFSLAVVTILNESLPHLGASLAGHVLGTGWAAYRVQSTERLRTNYLSLISGGACGGVDLLDGWWEVRRLHAIPILAVSALVLFATAYLSFKLFRVYASQSFSRVGASPQIHRMYKLVLLLSVSLQLTGFFSIASTAMWIDKISHGVIRFVAQHIKIYLVAFAVTLVLEIPWVILGWVSVRRECRWKYVVFCGLSIFLVVISTLMFLSPLYVFIFTTWPFFATITVTSYVLMVLTSLLSVWCRLNFGKGLAHFLQVSDALEGVNFTPVYFSNDAEKGTAFPVKFSDTEKSPVDEKNSSDFGYLQQPELSYSELAKPKLRGESVYSDANGMPVKLSSTPSLFKDAASTRRVKAFGGNHLDLGAAAGGDRYTQPQMPPRSAWSATTPSERPRSRDLMSLSSSGRASPTSMRSATPSMRPPSSSMPSATTPSIRAVTPSLRTVTPSAETRTPSVRSVSSASIASRTRPGLPANPRRRPSDA